MNHFLYLIADHLRSRGFEVEQFIAHPRLVVKQNGRSGCVRVRLDKDLISLEYRKGGNKLAGTLVELADPKSFMLMQRFLRTVFRTYGKR